jgi:tetratricopeptide (TPR) repeat protein
VWCDPCDNLFVSAYRPSWRWGWSSWSGLSFSYSSYSSSSSFSLGYAPLVVPAYSSAYCGSALLWNRPSVIYGVGWGASRWYPGTYINNVNVIGAGSDQYDPALNPSLSSSMNLPAVASTVTEADPVTMPVSELDRAAEAMQENQFGVAVEWLRSYLRNSPGDAKAMRWLSVALLANRNADDAAAMMRMAYSSDPALAGEPINRYELGLNNTELRDLVIRAGEYANSHDTGSSWLLVGVLMQAEGRASLAKTMFDRAAAAGCDPEIVNRLKAYTN